MENSLKPGVKVKILRAGGFPVGTIAIVQGEKRGFEGAWQVSEGEGTRKLFYSPEELEIVAS